MSRRLFFCLCLLQAVVIQICGGQHNNVSENSCVLPQLVAEKLSNSIGAETTNSMVTLTSVARVQNGANGEQQIQTDLNITQVTHVECPSLAHADAFSTSEFVKRLTAPCRYDRMERPVTPLAGGSDAVQVAVRAYIYAFDSSGGKNFQFNMQALLQMSYVDPRLAFASYAPSRTQPLQGEADLRSKIWVPHLFFFNEEDSSVLGTIEKDILTSISPDGTVILATRLQATIFCWSRLIKFPFDEQLCTTTLESWMYNSSDLVLSWETVSPLSFNPDMQFTKYTIERHWVNSTVLNAQDAGIFHAGLNGYYSAISFTVHLVRSAGYYVMDYFIPTFIMVAISWVSFWIRADQTPARTIMCCTTMLSLITLACSQLKNSSSFITIFEIWFLGCVMFIFSALIEFAFSNTIFRRTKDIKLKKVNSKCILKSTVVPQNKKKSTKPTKDKSSKLDCINCAADPSVIMTGCSTVDPHALNTSPSSVSFAFSFDSCSSVNMIEPATPTPQPQQTFATMTGQEISLWLDRRARFVFPLAFLIFNVFFWTFVMVL